jgi:hypothetical protein
MARGHFRDLPRERYVSVPDGPNTKTGVSNRKTCRHRASKNTILRNENANAVEAGCFPG